MGRWEPDARGRLSEAAFKLFAECGYDQTTVAEIAESAGLTKRTFFRYFADKREVLFFGGELLTERVVAAVHAADANLCPLDVVAAGLEATAEIFDAERRPFATMRQRIIDAHPDLRERELIKLSTMSDAVAAALRERGVAPTMATLSADAGMAVFRQAFERWIDPAADADMRVHVRAALAELRAVAAT